MENRIKKFDTGDNADKIARELAPLRMISEYFERLANSTCPGEEVEFYQDQLLTIANSLSTALENIDEALNLKR